MKAAGFSKGEMAEISAQVALNIFTNYFNKAADLAVEFPVVTMELGGAAIHWSPCC